MIMPRTEDEINNEMNDLDIPIIPITDVILIACDALDLDPLEFLDRYDAGDKIGDFEDASMIKFMIDQALESSFQIAHIRRALELEAEIASL
jgi:hypothetical protein